MGALCGTDQHHHQKNTTKTQYPSQNIQPQTNINNQKQYTQQQYNNPHQNNLQQSNIQNVSPNNQYGYNSQGSIINDPCLKKRGARYLIRQVKLEQYSGNVPGGKMPIKLIFSLDKQIINQNKNPSALKFDISISTIENPKNFKFIYTLDQIDLKDLVFSKQIITEYYFEIDQQIKIECLYSGTKIGEYYVSTAKINGSLNHTEEIPISVNRNPSEVDFKLIIISDPIAEELSRVAVSFDLKPEFNSNEEFFAVFNNNFNFKIQKVYKTEEAKGPFPKLYAKDIALGDLTFNGSKDQEFIIEFYSLSRGKIGSVVYNLNLTDNLNHDIRDDRNQTVGKCIINTSRKEIKRFIDYVYGGLQISLICGIDFTASNGQPKELNSLHYCLAEDKNQYQQALVASAGIIAYYDSDKKFPVYGFGGMYNQQTSHCFNCNFQNDPEVIGVDGILEAYKNAVHNVTFSGPTYFSPIITKTIEDIKSKGLNNNTYYILLILTDGQINDLDETRNRIVEASTLPLSIIIVGIGHADFSNMSLLDGDDNPLLDSKGRKIRDIVQFVQYDAKYKQNLFLFSQDLLFEIPNQVESFYS